MRVCRSSVLLGVLVAVALAGCGGGGSSSSAIPPSISKVSGAPGSVGKHAVSSSAAKPVPPRSFAASRAAASSGNTSTIPGSFTAEKYETSTTAERANPKVSHPPAPAPPAVKAESVAYVYTTPISKGSYEHWLAVYQAFGVSRDVSHAALGFLITSDWLFGEASAMGLSVSESEVKGHLEELKHKSYSKSGSFAEYLKRTYQTEADMLVRVHMELLESRIDAKVAGSLSGSQRTAALSKFQRTFIERWRPYTTCETGYVMEDCSEYKGPSENLSGATAQSSQQSNGEVPAHPGELSISSPAFGLNEEVPKEYTCDGKNISPALEWQNVPSNAKALVLFAIDDDENGPDGGIRWIVGDINPNTTGVEAGKIPEGGIVGSDTQGHPGYGGFCPEHGKTDSIQFELWALSEKIPLQSGFTPATAESEYAKYEIAPGAAETYASYHRQ
jgi:Raf kinase inhibitor-like YbhB/YbcL family protein